MDEADVKDLLNRREFSSKTLMALLGGVAVTVSACSSSNPAEPTPPDGGAGSGAVNGTISENHGHAASISQAQLTAGGEIMLDIRGTSAHAHSVTISAAEVATLATGGSVSKTSTTGDGHTHQVTFN